jgi:hypothetical protein
LAILTLSLNAWATDYAMMLQQAPMDGGSINPGVGVHSVPADGQVTITASPKAGYQFVYWLGDVEDAGSPTTQVRIDAPKIIVAVFERTDYEIPFATPAGGDSAGGGDRLIGHNTQPNNGNGYQGGGGPKQRTPDFFVPPIDTPTQGKDNPEFPVPEGKAEVPEPATVLLLGIGTLLGLRAKK